LGESSSIGFPGERSGSLPNRERWSEIEKVTLAFGYGLTATPLQLAQAYAVFANQGKRVPLTLLKRSAGEQAPSERVISKEIANQVLTVLHRVTGSEGTAKKARVPGFSVGGKTGTVHKVGPSGYLHDQYLALFVGVAPMDNPRYVTAVVIDRPKGDSYGGGAAAAPVYSRITDGVLRLRNQRPEIEAEMPAQLAGFGGSQ
jgi:cell division protein FtsI (penicillin-binding protein 3)